MHPRIVRSASQLAMAIGPALVFLAATQGCQTVHSKPAVEQADPLHADKAHLPPPELGLPPNPLNLPNAASQTFSVPKPPISNEMWPCSSCHDEPENVNRTRRPLKEEHLNIVLHHDEENRWCLDCHDATNRDVLHLASGVTITFDESYRLCGQCHGDKLRDWKVGVHGKRTGMWNGAKQYLLCVHCHSPHSPHFKPLKPEAPPVRPDTIR